MLAAVRNFAKSWVAAILHGPAGRAASSVWGVNQGVFRPSVGTATGREGGLAAPSARPSSAASSTTPRSALEQQQRPADHRRGGRQAGQLDRRRPERRWPPARSSGRADVARRRASPATSWWPGPDPQDPGLLRPDHRPASTRRSIQQRLARERPDARTSSRPCCATRWPTQHWAVAVRERPAARRAPTAPWPAVFGLEARDLGLLRHRSAQRRAQAGRADRRPAAGLREARTQAQLTCRRCRMLDGRPLHARRKAPRWPAPRSIRPRPQKRYKFRKDTLSKPRDPHHRADPGQGRRQPRRRSPPRLAPGRGPRRRRQVGGRRRRDLRRQAATRRDLRPQGRRTPPSRCRPATVATAPGRPGLGRGQGRSASRPAASVDPGGGAPLLEAEIRKDAAAEKVYALTQAYEDAQPGRRQTWPTPPRRPA